jgi:uncharacterized Zn-finger protein
MKCIMWVCTEEVMDICLHISYPKVFNRSKLNLEISDFFCPSTLGTNIPSLLFTDTAAVWGSHHSVSDSPSTFRSSCEKITISSGSAWTKHDCRQMLESCVNQRVYGTAGQVVTPWSPSGPKSKGLFPCPTCGKRYNYKHNLVRHIRQECGKEPQFHCPYCSHVTKRKASLQKHIHRRHINMPNIKWN